MSTIIIVLLLLTICIYAIISYRKKLSQGCCGSGGDIEKKIVVSDKNPANYPCSVTIVIDGMTCNHCKQRVENALNELDGVWADVNLSKHSALVRMKTQLQEMELRRAVIKAGYGVVRITKN